MPNFCYVWQPLFNNPPLRALLRYLLSIGASAEAENESGEKPADLIDPECKELVKIFEAGCVWAGIKRTRDRGAERKH